MPIHKIDLGLLSITNQFQQSFATQIAEIDHILYNTFI